MKKTRQSNLELLRIVSMFIIVMSHCDEIFGLSNLYSTTLGINKLITDWLHIGGQIGVGCFLLITGYFMVDQNITPKKIFKVSGPVWFYTIFIWLCWITSSFCLNNYSLLSIAKETVFAFFPILFSHYWFVTGYIILLLLSPFLNILINSLSKKQYIRLLLILIILFVVICGGIPLAFNNIIGGRLIPMVIIYFIAGYLKRFVELKKGNAYKHIIISILFYLILFASFYLITYIGEITKVDKIKEVCYFYRVLNSPLVVIICVELFIGFSKLNIKDSNFINLIAGSTFGVYLIHCNRIMENILLPKVFPIYKETNSLRIFLYSLISVFIIYIVCTIIDLIRRFTIDKLWNNYLDNKFKKHYNSISNKLSRISNWFVNILNKYYSSN